MLDKFINNLANLQKNVNVLLDKRLIKDLSDKSREQLSEGKREDGTNISYEDGRSTYSPNYKKQKQRKGLQNEYIDLKYSGTFHKSIKTQKKSKGVYENISNDSVYTGKLKGLFGGDQLLLGINEESANEIAEKLAQDIENLILKELA